MSGPKHTEGPFAVKEHPILMVVAPDDLVLCEITDLGDMAGAKEGEEYANALLFAAAPDLLEAAQKALETNDRVVCRMMAAKSAEEAGRIAQEGSDEFTTTLPALRAAIAKATGEAA